MSMFANIFWLKVKDLTPFHVAQDETFAFVVILKKT